MANPPPDPLNPPGGAYPTRRTLVWQTPTIRAWARCTAGQRAGWLALMPTFEHLFGQRCGSGSTESTSGLREGTASSLHCTGLAIHPPATVCQFYPALELSAAVKTLCRTAHVTLMPRHLCAGSLLICY